MFAEMAVTDKRKLKGKLQQHEVFFCAFECVNAKASRDATF